MTGRPHPDIPAIRKMPSAYKNQYMPGIIIGAVAAIAGAVLIPFVMGLGIIALVAGAVLCIVSAGLGAARKKEFQAGQEQIGAQAEKKIKMLESEINDDRVFIESARKLVKEFCDEYGIPVNNYGKFQGFSTKTPKR